MPKKLPPGEKKDVMLGIKDTPEQRDIYKKDARRRGMNFSVFGRAALRWFTANTPPRIFPVDEVEEDLLLALRAIQDRDVATFTSLVRVIRALPTSPASTSAVRAVAGLLSEQVSGRTAPRRSGRKGRTQDADGTR